MRRSKPLNCMGNAARDFGPQPAKPQKSIVPGPSPLDPKLSRLNSHPTKPNGTLAKTGRRYYPAPTTKREKSGTTR